MDLRLQAPLGRRPAGSGPAWWARSTSPTPVARSTEISGVDYTEYRVDGGDWVRSDNDADADPFVTTFSVSGNGDHTVEYRSVDGAGNVEADKSVGFRIQPTQQSPPSGGGTTQPPVGGDAPPAPDTEPFVGLSRPPRTSLAQFRKRGLRIRVTCNDAMSGRAMLQVTRKREPEAQAQERHAGEPRGPVHAARLEERDAQAVEEGRTSARQGPRHGEGDARRPDDGARRVAAEGDSQAVAEGLTDLWRPVPIGAGRPRSAERDPRAVARPAGGARQLGDQRRRAARGDAAQARAGLPPSPAAGR